MSPQEIKTELDKIQAKRLRLAQHPHRNAKALLKLSRTAWALEFQLKQVESARAGKEGDMNIECHHCERDILPNEHYWSLNIHEESADPATSMITVHAGLSIWTLCEACVSRDADARDMVEECRLANAGRKGT